MKYFTLFLTSFLGITSFTCSGTSTEDLLNGNFGTVDRTPPAIISPEDGTKVTNISTKPITLSWSSKIGAIYYTVEIAEDEEFLIQIAGSPFTVKSSESSIPPTSLEITVPDALTYYWRVRADITAEDRWSAVSSFHAFDDAVYVYCPDGEICNDTDKQGNKTTPFQTISGAQPEAKSLGLKINVAARGASAYNEKVNLLSGVEIYGGYDPADWSRNIVINTTSIENDGTSVISAISINKPTIFDGFSIKNTGSLDNNRGIYFEESNNNLSISNCEIESGTGDNSYGIYIYLSSSIINGCTITCGNVTVLARGVYISGSSPLIQECTIRTGTGNTTWGIYNLNSNSNIKENIIYGGDGNSESCGIYNDSSPASVIDSNKIHGGSGANSSAIKNSSSSPVIKNNILYSGTGPVGNWAIANTSYSSPLICGNISISGNGGTCTSVYNNLSFPVILNNILFGGISTDRSYGTFITNSYPVIINNVILGGNTSGTSSMGIRFVTNGDAHITNNTITGGFAGTQYSEGVMCQSGIPVINNNIIFTFTTSTRIGIDEIGAAPSDIKNNLIFDAPTALYYDDNNSAYYDLICPGGTFGTGDCTGPNALSTPTGVDNITAAGTGEVFSSVSIGYDFTTDGHDANSTYDGTSTRIEVTDCQDGRYVADEYIEYNNDGVARQIQSVTCSANESYIDLYPSDALSQSTAEYRVVKLWGSNNADYSRDRALLTSSPAMNAGLSCPDGFHSSVHQWGTGADQSECDAKFPGYGTTCNSGYCESTYLSPAAEIMGDSLGNDNGLCEAGEACVINPNIGAYAGHGGLVASGCDTSALPAPFTSNVILMIYESNGY